MHTDWTAPPDTAEAPPQARVFISYARVNQAAVRHCSEALAERGRALWVDWSDIPPSAEWMAEIEDGIRGADAFVFMLSAASLASPVCRQELDIALALEKRLVPVVLEAVPTGTVPAALARLNWVFLRPTDDFAAGLAALALALDTDLDWLRSHTALMQPALAWDDAGRERSRLLKGRALRQAEAWLVESARKSPAPAAVQLAFIQASAQAARRRLRQALGGAVAGVAVLVALSVWALLAERQAQAARRDAEARQLGADAALVVGEQAARIETSALLAIEAWKRRPALGNDMPLRAALRLLPEPLGTWSHAPERIAAACLRANGQWLVYGAGAQLFRRRADGSPAPAPLPLEAPVEAIMPCGPADAFVVRTARPGGPVRLRYWAGIDAEPLPLPGARAAACSADGRLLAMGDASGRITLLALDGGAAPPRLAESLDGPVELLRISADGRLLAASARERLRLWALDSGRPLAAKRLRRPIVDLDFAPDGSRLMAAADSGAYLWQLPEGRALRRLGELTNVHQARHAPDGAFIALGVGDGSVVLYDTARLERVRQMRHQSPVHHLRFDHSGRRLLSAGNDGTARLWRVDDGSEQLRFSHAGIVTAIDWSEAAGHILTAGRDGRLRLWRDRLPGRMLMDGPLRRTDTRLAGDQVRVAANAADILEPLGAGQWALRTFGATEPLLRLTTPSSIADFALSPDRQVIALTRFDRVIALHRISDGVLLAELRPGAMSDTLGFSPDGESLLTGSQDGQVRLWAWRDGALRWQHAHAPFIFSHAFSADGRQVATGGSDQTVHLLDARNGALLRRWTLPSYPDADNDVKALAFDPAAPRLAVGSSDHRVRLFRLDDGPPGPVLQHRNPVLALAFSPDGRWLASSASDDMIRLWLPDEGTERARFRAPDAAIALGFAGGLLRVFTGGEWAAHAVAPEAVVAAACARLPPRLSAQDGRDYLGTSEPAPTCPATP